jgi:hypothetical protein
MLILENFLEIFNNDIESFWQTISSNSKLFFFILIFLLLIVGIFVIVIIDKKETKRQLVSKQSITKNNKDNIIEKIESSLDNEIDEENEKTRNLKEITDKLQKVIDSRNEEVENFEREQEESSIISYDELRRANDKNKNNFMEEKQVEKRDFIRELKINEPIKEEKQDVEKSIVNKDKFQKSEFISPIYGVQDYDIKSDKKHNETEEVIKNETKDLESTEKLYEEDEFLLALKKFRNTLD